MNPTQQKQQMRHDIMKAVEQGKPLSKDKLIAQFSLNTGFRDETIKAVLDQLETLGYIKVVGDVITRAEAQQSKEAEE